MTVGSVIRWDRFPHPRHGEEVKARWFIYLGCTPPVITPITLYFCTTTTQIEKFERGGSRDSHPCKRFPIRQFPIFEQDCILDYDEDLHPMSRDAYDRCRGNIEVKGRLDENTMRNIYKQYLRPGVVSPRMMKDIHDSFNRDGITGLKMPR